MAWQEHQTVWLQPWCEDCEAASLSFSNDGRQWCQDEVWDECECGSKPVAYAIKTAQGGQK